MIDGGFAVVDIPMSRNAAFMKEKTEEFLTAAREGGIVN
jgi:hypothetical protein